MSGNDIKKLEMPLQGAARCAHTNQKDDRGTASEGGFVGANLFARFP